MGRSRRPLSRQLKGNAYAMKPSIMQSDKDKDYSYDDIVNCEQVNNTPRLHRSNDKIKGKSSVAAKMDNFIDELIDKKINKK